MLTMEEWMDLKLLSVQGHSIPAIAELTGLSRNTVRRALRQKTPQAFPRQSANRNWKSSRGISRSGITSARCQPFGY